jgi:K(+)-stimulated pyrophosphate-energized sodium pump
LVKLPWIWYEVRRQFREILELWKELVNRNMQNVDISTKAALREMMLPGILTIGFPIVGTGKLVYGDNNQLVAEMLGGYMAGLLSRECFGLFFKTTQVVLGIMPRNLLKQGFNGEMTYKGSDAHKAAVTGDTVGDPFKDTSGHMNILIKLTCLIGLVMAPILGMEATISIR